MVGNRDYLEIGSTPHGEDCAQVGSANYFQQTMIETKVFINQLKRVFGEPPEGAYFKLRSNPHDFGSYHEVAVWYDEFYPKSVDYAYEVENNVPEYWDEEAKKELSELLNETA